MRKKERGIKLIENMSASKNSVIIKSILQSFIGVIDRRTSENFAISTINTMLEQLEPKYDFLKYIEIKGFLYSERADAAKYDFLKYINIIINPKINYVKTSDIGKAINEILDMLAGSLIENADYYFIKEIKYTFESEIGPTLRKYDIDLDSKQFEHLINMAEISKLEIIRIKNSEIIEPTLTVLTELLNKYISEKNAIKTIINSLKKLESRYDFLKYVKIKDTPDSKGFYTVDIKPEIDNIMPAKMGKAIQSLIEEAGKSTDLKTHRFFVADFKNELGEENLSKIKRMGVNLYYIDRILQQQGNELLTRKTLEVLIDLVGKKTSKSFAVASIDKLIEEIRDEYDVLKYIKIDKSRYNDGIDAISIVSGINSVGSYKFGKAIKEIIKKVQDNFGDKSSSFIENFKKKFGKEYLSEIEKIGVNLHLIDLRRFI